MTTGPKLEPSRSAEARYWRWRGPRHRGAGRRLQPAGAARAPPAALNRACGPVAGPTTRYGVAVGRAGGRKPSKTNRSTFCSDALWEAHSAGGSVDTSTSGRSANAWRKKTSPSVTSSTRICGTGLQPPQQRRPCGGSRRAGASRSHRKSRPAAGRRRPCLHRARRGRGRRPRPAARQQPSPK